MLFQLSYAISCFLAVTRFPDEIGHMLCELYYENLLDFVMSFHAFWPTTRFFAVCCIICDGICREGATVAVCERSLPSLLAFWDLLVRFCAFCFFIFVSDFLMRLYAFCCIIFLRDLLKRIHAFLALRDVLMQFVAFLLHTFLMIFPDDISCLLAVMRCPYVFCRTIFVRDVVMRFHAFGGRFELCAWEFMLFWPLWEMPWWDVVLFGCRLFFLMVWCKDGGEVKEAGDWVYAMAYWTLRSFACTN